MGKGARAGRCGPRGTDWRAGLLAAAEMMAVRAAEETAARAAETELKRGRRERCCGAVTGENEGEAAGAGA